MTIYFSIKKKGGSFISEGTLSTNLSEYADDLHSRKPLTGAITIEHNGIECMIEDELGALINNFCMATLPDLIETGKATYDFFEYYGQVSVELIDDSVGVTGDFITEIIIPKIEFISQAFECAGRYISFLKLMNEPHFVNDLTLLEGTYKNTQQYLNENHKL